MTTNFSAFSTSLAMLSILRALVFISLGITLDTSSIDSYNVSDKQTFPSFASGFFLMVIMSPYLSITLQCPVPSLFIYPRVCIHLHIALEYPRAVST